MLTKSKFMSEKREKRGLYGRREKKLPSTKKPLFSFHAITASIKAEKGIGYRGREG